VQRRWKFKFHRVAGVGRSRSEDAATGEAKGRRVEAQQRRGFLETLERNAELNSHPEHYSRHLQNH
jgi:hypothetical protein